MQSGGRCRDASGSKCKGTGYREVSGRVKMPARSRKGSQRAEAEAGGGQEKGPKGGQKGNAKTIFFFCSTEQIQPPCH